MYLARPSPLFSVGFGCFFLWRTHACNSSVFASFVKVLLLLGLLLLVVPKQVSGYKSTAMPSSLHLGAAHKSQKSNIEI